MPEAIPKVAIQMRVNGSSYSREVEPRLLLVEFLREEIELTGTHIGCDTTYCGACTVLLNGAAVKSCTMFAVQADGAEITTVEGLERNGELHPIQRGLAASHGLQCGYCTPAMMFSALPLLSGVKGPDKTEIRKALAGNPCRCTGYQNLFRAVEAAARAMRNSSGGD